MCLWHHNYNICPFSFFPPSLPLSPWPHFFKFMTSVFFTNCYCMYICIFLSAAFSVCIMYVCFHGWPFGTEQPIGGLLAREGHHLPCSQLFPVAHNSLYRVEVLHFYRFLIKIYHTNGLSRFLGGTPNFPLKLQKPCLPMSVFISLHMFYLLSLP